MHESMSPIGDEIENEQSDEWLPSIGSDLMKPIPERQSWEPCEADHPDEDACHRRKDAEHGCGEGYPTSKESPSRRMRWSGRRGKSCSNGTKMAKSNTRATIAFKPASPSRRRLQRDRWW